MQYALGQYTTASIRAPFDFSVIDEDATTSARREAARRTVPVADWDSRLPPQINERLANAFANAQKLHAEIEALKTPSQEELAAVPKWKRTAFLQERAEQANKQKAEEMDAVVRGIERALTIRLDDDARTTLSRTGGTASFVDGMIALVARAYAKPIVEDLAPFDELVVGAPGKTEGPGRLALKDSESGSTRTITKLSLLSDRNEVEMALGQELDHVMSASDAQSRSVALNIVLSQIRPNVFFNAKETELRRQTASTGVLPVAYSFKKNQLILGEGQEVTQQKLMVLDHVQSLSMPKEYRTTFWGIALVLALPLIMAFSVIRLERTKARINQRDCIFLATCLAATLIFFRLWLSLEEGLLYRYPDVPHLAWLMVFPVCATAMYARLMVAQELAVIQSALVALIAGSLANQGVYYATHCFAVGLFATHAVATCSRRGSVIRAGFKTGVVAAIGGLGLAAAGSVDLGLPIITIAAAALVGGTISGFIVVAASPVAEWLFGYTTDTTLLERSSYDQLLLRRLLSDAPGTFQHSVSVGILAEAAAKSVGANALLVRVGALYHDIGKLQNPECFTENQTGHNPHDALTPIESARILMAHVTDGVRLAERYKLGKRITELIQQHHGTDLTRSFYEKAVQAGGNVDPGDFRYPGPKPLSREAAIMMIADQVEATARSMGTASEQDYKAMIARTVERLRSAEQLDSCPLTFADLANIQVAVTAAVVGIQHRRVKYPGQGLAEKGSAPKAESVFTARDTDRSMGGATATAMQPVPATATTTPTATQPATTTPTQPAATTPMETATHAAAATPTPRP